MCTQIAVISADTAEKFQEAFNSKLRELEHQNPQFEFHHGTGFCAYITYSDNSLVMGIVEPANVCICDQCLRCAEPPRPHAKWRKCALYGSVNRDRVCEDFVPGGSWDEC